MRSFVIPCDTPSITNRREHWAARARRAKAHRRDACLLWRANTTKSDDARYRRLGCIVTLTRVGSRNLDDDNLRAALKSIRDGIADAIGLDDGDKRLDWRYQQAHPCRPNFIPGVLVMVLDHQRAKGGA